MDFMSGLEKFGFNASDMGDIFADENGGSPVRKTEAEKKEARFCGFLIKQRLPWVPEP